MRALPALLLCASLSGGCFSPPRAVDTDAQEMVADDLALRILEEMAQPPADPVAVMNALERLMPSWQGAQRRLKSAPIEREITRKVVVNFDVVAAALHDGPHERAVVAAWALGFARVPDNDLGVDSRHLDALELLVPLLVDQPDDLTGNAILGIWLLADSSTPLRPLSSLVMEHHDPVVRANACLALGSVITKVTAQQATEAFLVALADTDSHVRLHAADAAYFYPSPALTTQIQSVMGGEQTPFVLAAMVRALGASGARSSTALLVFLLASPREVVAVSARQALIDLWGQDKGPAREDWAELIKASERS